MKIKTTVSLDKVVYDHLRYKPNRSQYINDLVVADIYEKKKDVLARRTAEELMGDVRFKDYVQTLVKDYMEGYRG